MGVFLVSNQFYVAPHHTKVFVAAPVGLDPYLLAGLSVGAPEATNLM
jgi:hypothetical protein